MIEAFLTTRQVAEAANYSPDTIIRWVKEGRCPCVNPEGGSHYRFRVDEIETWLANGFLMPRKKLPANARRKPKNKVNKLTLDERAAQFGL